MCFINGFDDYSVTEDGRIYSHRRIINNQHFGGRFLKKRLNLEGYYKVTLMKNRKPFEKKVHRLIAECFIPNPNNKPCINHKDGNKQNNQISNLEWVTYKENTAHAIKHGLFVFADPNLPRVNRKLDKEQIKEIFENYQENSQNKGLNFFANKFGLSTSAVSNLLKGKTYKEFQYLKPNP